MVVLTFLLAKPLAFPNDILIKALNMIKEKMTKVAEVKERIAGYSNFSFS